MISLGKKWFGGDAEEERDGLADLRLETMRNGDLVDYDLKTWEVTGRSAYDYEGFPAQEWQLTSGNDVCFLERSEEDGKTEWILTRSIDVGDIQEDVTAALTADEDPPAVIHFQNRTYEATESSAGVQTDLADDGSTVAGSGREFISWSYEGEERRVLFLAQWGEQRFTAYEGEQVEEYSFTDILPGGER
jgi:hypothetical protein